MKQIARTLFVLLCVCALSSQTINAQKSAKELNKELKAKANRTAIKEAKAYKKEGWKTMPGTLSLDKQIESAKKASIQTDSDGVLMYYMASCQAVGGNYAAAKQIASNRAKLDLVRSATMDVADKTIDQLANNNLGEGDIELIDETVTTTQFSANMNLKGVSQFVEIYRELDNGNVEVMVTQGVERKSVEKEFRKNLRESLSGKLDKLADELGND